MATYTQASINQGTYEIRKWTVDFTNDLPTGVSVSSGTAYHTPPSGTAAAVTITTASPYINAQLGPLSVTGVHYLDVVGTFSNAEVSQVRITFPVGYATPTARAGMVDLIEQVRVMADAGANDFTVAGVPYWSDAQVQNVLDRHRNDFVDLELAPVEFLTNGTTDWRDFYLPYTYVEQGTAAFTVKDTVGTAYGTSVYTVDYQRGVITWATNVLGSSILVTGRHYDLNGAAAEVWRFKAANVAKYYDFSTDNHRMSRSQLRQNFLDMAQYYSGLAGPVSIEMYRGDMDTYDLD